MIKKKPRFYTCQKCNIEFSHDDVVKVCSNCFACTGCEVYLCPSCSYENVFKEIKKPSFE